MNNYIEELKKYWKSNDLTFIATLSVTMLFSNLIPTSSSIVNASVASENMPVKKVPKPKK